MSLTSAISIATSGMQAATTRLNVAASNIANVDTADYKPLAVRQTELAGGGVAASVMPRSGVDPTVDLGDEVVDVIGARAAYLASLAVVTVADDMFRSLLDATSDHHRRHDSDS